MKVVIVILPEEIINTLWSNDNVERRRTRFSFFKVTYPKFAPGELPLHVSPFLLNIEYFTT